MELSRKSGKIAQVHLVTVERVQNLEQGLTTQAVQKYIFTSVHL